MGAYGSKYTSTFTTGSGGSATVDLQASYRRIFLHIPAPGAAIDIQASVDGTNYGALRYPLQNATSGLASFLSSYSNQVVEIPGGLRYYKFINTLATGAGESIRIYGTDL